MLWGRLKRRGGALLRVGVRKDVEVSMAKLILSHPFCAKLGLILTQIWETSNGSTSSLHDSPEKRPVWALRQVVQSPTGTPGQGPLCG